MYDGAVPAVCRRRGRAQNLRAKIHMRSHPEVSRSVPLALSLGPGTCWTTAERMNESSVPGTGAGAWGRQRRHPHPGSRLSREDKYHFRQAELDYVAGGPLERHFAVEVSKEGSQQ